MKFHDLGSNRPTYYVAPLAGAWIEICSDVGTPSCVMSLPSRERGLKYTSKIAASGRFRVAPLAGAWIEITCDTDCSITKLVAPLAGAWIEILSHLFAPADL